MATTGYQAGAETNDLLISYIDEAAWGTLPATPTFKPLRVTSESLSSTKARTRVQEIDSTRQASDMVTTQFSASGSINSALSIGVYDDFLESLFCSAFTTDIMTNGVLFQSMYIQKKLGTGLYFRYPGAYVTGCSIQCALGGFATATWQIAAQQELKATTAAETTMAAVGTGKVFNTVSMISLIQIGGVSAGTVESISLDITNDGAAALFGMGSTIAAGMLPGTFTVSGRIRIYFQNFTAYDRYTAETEGAFQFKLTDGNTSYLFEVLNSVIMNPQIVAGGPSQAVMAEFSIEGRKDSVTGKTLRVTRDLTP